MGQNMGSANRNGMSLATHIALLLNVNQGSFILRCIGRTPRRRSLRNPGRNLRSCFLTAPRVNNENKDQLTGLNDESKDPDDRLN